MITTPSLAYTTTTTVRKFLIKNEEEISQTQETASGFILTTSRLQLSKEAWTDLVHSFEGPSDSKEERIMYLKLEYQAFRTKSTESLSQTYTRYKTLINELANDGVNLSKHEINTLDLEDIYGRFVYEDNLIQRRYSDTKKALITTLSSSAISTAFFSNNVIQAFQENSDDEVDERSSEEYLRDLEIEYHERALLANSKRKFLKSSESKDFQPKNNGLISKIFDWDEEEVSEDEEVTQVKVLMALADDELTIRKSHARNGEYVDITIRKYAPSSKQILKAKAKIFPPCIHYGFNDHRLDDCRNYLECEIYRSYDHSTTRYNYVIHIREGVLAESSQSNESSIRVKCNTCRSIVHFTSHHNEFDHFKRGEKAQDAKGAHMVPGQWMLKEYDWCQELSAKICRTTGPKVVFGDNSFCITEGYGSINYEAPRRNDVYVLDMSSLTLNGAYFFAKVSKSVNWLWHKRLSHLNFKNINKLAKQNQVLFLPSLVYSKDKPCIACEKGKHHRASFKTKQNFSIKKCLHLLHMDLFGPVSPMSINHEKYTLVIVDEYSRYIWVYILRKKSQAPEMIMSFVRIVDNQINVKVKQIKTDNGTEFRNHELEIFCNEKGISQNFSSPYTLEQNGVAERKNKTLIEAARTMLNGSVLSKHLWTEAAKIACYTQNRSIIVKRHDKTPYEIFRERIPDLSYFHVFGCLVFIHNHKDYLGKFYDKADDGYFLGYSSVSKAFRVCDTRR
uniref:Retrovirus-related Pol polyprotein from transposon TNT 1-94 n=1 Tax=Tanacetum cinerariifolium TaxID=118510 RepID=A0A6L2MF70_TANCI|nr:retrovirus-related Pol polyprotein from transposon TNT 1-94 [Tanacetum cinerariifolium]